MTTVMENATTRHATEMEEVLLAKVKTLEATVEEQLHTIKALNSCIGVEGSTTTENLSRIGELEASVREWSDRAMEFSNLASKYEEELAALRQQQGEPVGNVVVWADRSGIERADFDFYGNLPEGMHELYCEAAQKQQGEPVAVVFQNQSGQIHLITPEGDAFDMSKYVGENLYREAAPRVSEGWKLVPVELVNAAKGLCFGVDWNNGTHARIHRPRLIAALRMLTAAPEPQPRADESDNIKDIFSKA